jgi:hypothetical protein
VWRGEAGERGPGVRGEGEDERGMSGSHCHTLHSMKISHDTYGDFVTRLELAESGTGIVGYGRPWVRH